jgi:hypothetical protein
VLADRGLSRLLGSDWPRTLDELEELRRRGTGAATNGVGMRDASGGIAGLTDGSVCPTLREDDLEDGSRSRHRQPTGNPQALPAGGLVYTK